MRRLKNLIGLGIVFVSTIKVQAEPLQLMYDGGMHLYDLPAITLSLNGEMIETPYMPPIQLDNRTLVPIREVFEPVGAFVEWKPDEQKVYIDYNDILMVLEIDNPEVWINGSYEYLEVPAKVINNKIMVPLRFISEAIGFAVKWDSAIRNIDITALEQEEEPVTPEMPEIPNEYSLNHITYLYGDTSILLDMPKGLELNSITVEDNYRDRELIIDLGRHYTEYFGEGIALVGDDVIDSIQVLNDETTKIIIDETIISTYEITVDNKQILFDLISPKEKYEQILVIDIGHGGSKPGTVANGVQEKDINMKQVEALKYLLEQDQDIKVYYTREEDVNISLDFRSTLANEVEADIFISLHNNAFDENSTGTEVLYYPETRSKEAAQVMQDVLIARTGMVDRGIKESPDIYVLKASNMPSILLEGGFLTNPEEAELLQSESFTQTYALAVYEGILKIFEEIQLMK